MRRTLATLCIAGALVAGLSVPAFATPFLEGQTARAYYEQWFGGLGDPQKAGAAFWAGERSKPHPQSCFSNESATTPLWLETCLEAQKRLQAADLRRTTEPEFRKGWNSYEPAGGLAPVKGSTQPYGPSSKAQNAARQQEEQDAKATCDPNDFLMDFDQSRYDARAVERCQARRTAAQNAIAQRRADEERMRQVATENSPDNLCAVRDTARSIMEDMGRFAPFKDRGIEIVDIEHLTTVTAAHPNTDMACHGTFITNRGIRLTGVYSTRRNIAGDPINSWKLDQ